MKYFLTANSNFNFIHKKELVNYNYYVTLHGAIDNCSGSLINYYHFQNILAESINNCIAQKTEQECKKCAELGERFRITGENLVELVYNMLKNTDLGELLYKVSLSDHKHSRFTYPCQIKN